MQGAIERLPSEGEAGTDVGRAVQRWAIDLTTGVTASFLVAWLLREGAQTFERNLSRGDSVTGNVTALLACGALCVAVIALGIRRPVVVYVPAVLGWLVYGSLLIGEFPPSWYPEWVHSLFLASAGPMPVILNGAFTTAAMSSMWRTRRREKAGDLAGRRT